MLNQIPMRRKARKISIFLIFAVLILLVAILIKTERFAWITHAMQFTPTALAALAGHESAEQTGCCETICQETSADECPGNFNPLEACSELPQCNIGCCLDQEKYCLSNYLKGSCEEKKGTFISKYECLHYPLCLIDEPFGSLKGSTGYPALFKASEEGILLIETPSYKKGEPVFLKTFLFEQKGQEVKASIISEDFLRIMQLYDDGEHGDSGSADGVYAAVWFTHNFPEFEGIKIIDIIPEVDGKNTIEQDYLLLSSNRCMPLRKPWEKGRENIIVIETIHDEDVFLGAANLRNVLGIISAAVPREQFDEKNFVGIREVIRDLEQRDAVRIILDECYDYSSYRDTVLFLDDNAAGCTKEGNIIRTQSLLLLRKEAAEGESRSIDYFMENFCELTLTQNELERMAAERLSPPNISFILPQNDSFFQENEINFTFMIDDSADDEVYYEIYIDINRPESIIANGTTESGVATSKIITIPDGIHSIWIEATDSHRNLAYSDSHVIDVDAAGFVIKITSLDPLYYNSSPEINFTIDHREESSLNYIIWDYGEAIKEGLADIGEFISYPPNLTNGTHMIRITSQDSQEREAYSLPYIIYIGVEE